VAGDAAVARLHSEFPTHQFDDLVSLLRVDGRWRIVLKVFHRREPADAPLPAPAQVDAEQKAIREVLARAFQAIDAGDGARLGSTALSRAQTYAVDRGELVAVSVPGWQARLDHARAQGKARPSAREVDWGGGERRGRGQDDARAGCRSRRHLRFAAPGGRRRLEAGGTRLWSPLTSVE